MVSLSAFTLPVHIIGTGGVGSHVAIALARMGVKNIHLYDGDKFEVKNLANQALSRFYVGWYKTKALQHMMKDINDQMRVVFRRENVSGYIPLKGIVILCLDSMSSRELIMRECLEGKVDIDCVIETRMDSETGIVHCFDPNNARHCACWWEQFYPDAEAVNAAGCSGAESIISAVYGTAMLALRCFERYAVANNCYSIPNRVYQNFDTGTSRQIVWATDPDWD